MSPRGLQQHLGPLGHLQPHSSAPSRIGTRAAVPSALESCGCFLWGRERLWVCFAALEKWAGGFSRGSGLWAPSSPPHPPTGLVLLLGDTLNSGPNSVPDSESLCLQIVSSALQSWCRRAEPQLRARLSRWHRAQAGVLLELCPGAQVPRNDGL